MWFDLLLSAGLFFLLSLLFLFLRLLFGFLLAFILLAFVSHNFLLSFFDFSAPICQPIRQTTPNSLQQQYQRRVEASLGGAPMIA
jgi:hypothetical protein